MVSTGLVAENRRARYDYEIVETFEAGLVLTGSEVKSLRARQGQIAEGYVSPEGGEIWLVNAHIGSLAQAARFNHEERRRRKLLLNKREIDRLTGGVEKTGFTIVPLKLYFNDRGVAKLLIGLARGKKRFDKRETEKRRDWDRQKSRLMKERE